MDELSGNADDVRGIKAEVTNSEIGVGDADRSDESDRSHADAEGETADGVPDADSPTAETDANHDVPDEPGGSGGAGAHTNRDQPATRPGAILGGPFLPGALARRFALTAKIRKVCHPGDSPPEPRYTPSRRLAEFVRCRDLTCRFPGCSEPATTADIDHTIAWPIGPTCASNLKCLCRRHHLLKTFWGGPNGWRDRQLPDGTIIWTSPRGRTYTTEPGSKLLFPSLCVPTGPVAITDAARTAAASETNPGLTMPRRKQTRARDRARRIADDRRLNEAGAELLDPGVRVARVTPHPSL
ncbi:hypothetical protein MARA_11570 [Mycolicibacterium arabiense]|uniref:HNH nuclease domain-containing protein n=1 Tax=Mycolicibacterium arabiense TaxID=1286181 RepID=A0A7I7RUP7_9MYCO|nr:DUF222 domain-containing protein [Mycolicibacterium arabiense]BBY47689.1 hypothetical protein MARA_11570 [Mycolicibacterium arabiense]